MKGKKLYFLAFLIIFTILCGAIILRGQKKFKQVKIVDILNNPAKYDGKYIKVIGNYCGWKIPEDLLGPPTTSPPETRSDWIICDETGWIYVVAKGASPNLNPMEDYGQKISIYAQVRTKTINNTVIPYLYPIKIETTEQ